jgi:hypothetical protein
MTDSMQRKLRPSEVGYFGKGVPDSNEMAKLQSTYAARILKDGYVAPSVREKLKRMQDLQHKAFGKRK